MRSILIAVVLVLGFCVQGEARSLEKQYIVVHHTATPPHIKRFEKAECDAAHRQVGYDECGYNFLVDREGVVHPARSLDKPGAHSQGIHNYDGIGISFVLDGRVEEPSDFAIEAFRSLSNQLRGLYGNLKIIGHGKQYGGTGNTLCPTDAVWERVKSL